MYIPAFSATRISLKIPSQQPMRNQVLQDGEIRTYYFVSSSRDMLPGIYRKLNQRFSNNNDVEVKFEQEKRQPRIKITGPVLLKDIYPAATYLSIKGIPKQEVGDNETTYIID